MRAAVIAVALAGALVPAGCVDSEGEVLSTIGGDGSVDDIDGGGGGGPDGAVDPCAMELSCPDPLPATVTVCGRVLDVETSQYVPGDGTITISFFNPVDFPFEPSLAETQADECGRFIVENVFGALPPFVIASTDDDVLLGGDYTRVVSLVPNNPGNSVRANVYVMRTATDDAWSAQAGFAGSNFSDLGAVVMLYIDLGMPAVTPFQGAPVTNVTVTENGASSPPRDYYFSDTSSISRATIDPALTRTGVNGAGVITGPLPTNEYSGAHANCTFGEVRGGVPGFIQVQEMLGTCN